LEYSDAEYDAAAAILINGTGLSLNQTTCTAGIVSCIALYAMTKLFIYAYLIEKVRFSFFICSS
jgi:hypothetical protein